MNIHTNSNNINKNSYNSNTNNNSSNNNSSNNSNSTAGRNQMKSTPQEDKQVVQNNKAAPPPITPNQTPEPQLIQTGNQNQPVGVKVFGYYHI
jgi:hypothetical protein